MGGGEVSGCEWEEGGRRRGEKSELVWKGGGGVSWCGWEGVGGGGEASGCGWEEGK